MVRDDTESVDNSWISRISEQWSQVKDTTTTMVFSPQRMVFLSACSASLTLWQKVSASDIFQ